MASLPAVRIILYSDLVELVANSPRVIVPLAGLATQLEIDRETAWRLAGEAADAGLLDRWASSPKGESVTLTPLVIEQLGIRPDSRGTRWLES